MVHENIVLEVAKEDLESVMQTGELDGNWPRVQAIAKGAAEGLAHLHSFDRVHGDLKANNILLSAEDDMGKWGLEADVYAFGCILHELITSEMPANGASTMDASVADRVPLGSVAPSVDEEFEDEILESGLVRRVPSVGRVPTESVTPSVEEDMEDVAMEPADADVDSESDYEGVTPWKRSLSSI
ncbi:hypothetical protein BGX23_006239 [Mortierella sp. AD031]|nr:hypothetical protein BGX23_006239 [Mortierella sp. AD031]